jgi:hypothetical protein
LKRRRHLFEFGDQPWLPKILHDTETAYLSAAYRFFPISGRWAEKIATALRPGEPAEILDLCSGSGGAMPAIIKKLERRGYKARATLTDLFPNPQPSSDPRISWIAEPVDATRVPPHLLGVRTMFSAFHHFRPQAAKAILKDAYDRHRAICIFESGPGTPLGIALMLGVPINVLAFMPFARPFRWKYLLFTYLIPIVPLLMLWDGIVSMLRIYSPEQMEAMIDDLRGPGYAWETGRIYLKGLGGFPYLIGRPIAGESVGPESGGNDSKGAVLALSRRP